MIRKNVKGVRLLAAIIDALAFGAVVVVIEIILRGFFGISLDFSEFQDINDLVLTDYMEYTIILTVLTAVVGFLYFVYYPAKNNGQTFGKRAMRIRVIVQGTDEAPELKTLALRCVVMYSNFVAVPLLAFYALGTEIYTDISSTVSFFLRFLVFSVFLTILINERGEGLHDKMFRTLVVDERYTLKEENIQVETSETTEEKDPFSDDFEAFSKTKDPWDE